MTVGERIKQRRLELGYTQEQLAEKMGYSGKSSVCKAETYGNNITTAKVKKYAEALDCSFDYLMGWNTKETQKAESYGSLVAGIIRDDDMMQILEYSQKLQPAQRKQVADYIKFLLNQENVEG